ncbi:MAG: mercury resistance system periplasmic binding protein MerP [Rudaea sp.]|uniref:mercury resistance system periplasmic binding protein MerP n=1 Tax=unclassified Rudaea TaxID=2627037 RepID=UPI0010F43D8F|nr:MULTISPECIES: mercury resistance system periplasmic binding protein MerP [unclassified Rudaea]MBN8888478.1 mercury resistance system periplasmic binding protein MerP [Rudaea sp.]MBR0345270.1 mercury resistance system periplasmic binding protein MerP [Rudaea sp.]
MFLRIIAAVSTLVFVTPSWAAPRTVTLSVPGMDCPACPITIKKALVAVPGVSQAEVRFDNKQAVVTFDDAKATQARLIQATTDAGYPSKVVEIRP